MARPGSRCGSRLLLVLMHRLDACARWSAPGAHTIRGPVRIATNTQAKLPAKGRAATQPSAGPGTRQEMERDAESAGMDLHPGSPGSPPRSKGAEAEGGIRVMNLWVTPGSAGGLEERPDAGRIRIRHGGALPGSDGRRRSQHCARCAGLQEMAPGHGPHFAPAQR